MKPLILSLAVLMTGCAAQLAQRAPAAQAQLADRVDEKSEPAFATLETSAVKQPTFLDRACARAGLSSFGWSNFVAVSSVPVPSVKREEVKREVLPTPRFVPAVELARLEPVECGLHALYVSEKDPAVRTDVLGLKDDIVRLQSRGVLATVSGQPNDARAFYKRRDAFQVRFAAFKERVQVTRPDVSWSCEAAP